MLNTPQAFRRQHTPLTVSPVARMRADTLLDYITERGGKLYLTWKHYRALQRLRLYPHAVDAAVETLYADGAIDVRLAGNTPVLEVVEAR